MFGSRKSGRKAKSHSRASICVRLGIKKDTISIACVKIHVRRYRNRCPVKLGDGTVLNQGQMFADLIINPHAFPQRQCSAFRYTRNCFYPLLLESLFETTPLFEDGGALESLVAIRGRTWLHKLFSRLGAEERANLDLFNDTYCELATRWNFLVVNGSWSGLRSSIFRRFGPIKEYWVSRQKWISLHHSLDRNHKC